MSEQGIQHSTHFLGLGYYERLMHISGHFLLLNLMMKQVPPELVIRVSIALLSNSSDGSDELRMDSLVKSLQQELVIGSSIDCYIIQ